MAEETNLPVAPGVAADPGMTLVGFLLDRTGSMEGVRDATIEGFNGYLESLRGTPAPIVDDLDLTAPG